MDAKLGSIIMLTERAEELMDTEFLAADLRRRRDAAIIEARAQGNSLRTIADAAMVSHQTVANIIQAAEQASLEVS
ncbi:MAG TPA: hypothetical protein VIG24_13730 [Acidimicrobiia bacterium]